MFVKKNMKKVGLVLVVFFAFILVGCAKTRVTDTFRFESRELEIIVGEEKKLGIIMGDLDEDSIIIYTTSLEDTSLDINPNDILCLSGSDSTYYYRDTTQGKNDILKVKGVSVGTVLITASIKDSPNVTDTIKVKVVEEKLGGYQILSESNSIYVGSALVVKTVTYPDQLEWRAVYSSSDESIAKVYQSGLIEGLKPGTVTIYAKSIYDEKIIAAKEFTVLYTTTESVSVSKDNINLFVGSKYQIDATANPELAEQLFTYSSANAKIASVDKNGVITALDAGTTNITVKNGTKTAKIVVNVNYVGATKLVVKSTEVEMENQTTSTVNYNVEPYNANQKAEYEILEGSDVVEVTINAVLSSGTSINDSNIKIKGLKAGTAKIKVFVKDTPYSEIITVTVSIPSAQSITVNAYNGNVLVGDTVKLTGKVIPSGALQGLSFTSSNLEIATVDETGLVTMLKQGTVTITIKDETETVEKACEFTVYDIATSIEVTGDPDNGTVQVGDSFTLVATLLPNTALQTGFKVSQSDNGDFIDISNVSGQVGTYEVLALDVGTVTITITVGTLVWEKQITVIEKILTKIG